MSQSEDYLDGLLNSINKAKTDAIEVQEKAEKKQHKVSKTQGNHKITQKKYRQINKQKR